MKSFDRRSEEISRSLSSPSTDRVQMKFLTDGKTSSKRFLMWNRRNWFRNNREKTSEDDPTKFSNVVNELGRSRVTSSKLRNNCKLNKVTTSTTNRSSIPLNVDKLVRRESKFPQDESKPRKFRCAEKTTIDNNKSTADSVIESRIWWTVQRKCRERRRLSAASFDQKWKTKSGQRSTSQSTEKQVFAEDDREKTIFFLSSRKVHWENEMKTFFDENKESSIVEDQSTHRTSLLSAEAFVKFFSVRRFFDRKELLPKQSKRETENSQR